MKYFIPLLSFQKYKNTALEKEKFILLQPPAANYEAGLL